MWQISMQANVKYSLSKYNADNLSQIAEIIWNRRLQEGTQPSLPQAPILEEAEPNKPDETVQPSSDEDSTGDEAAETEKVAVLDDSEEDLNQLTELMRKLIIVKNKFLDELCNNDSLWDGSTTIEVTGD